jgi:hypothetical protein
MQIPADSQTFLFDRVVETQTVSDLHNRAFEAMAEDIATRLLAGALGQLVPACGTDRTRWAAACADAFLVAVQERAYRRPVTADEKALAMRMFSAGRTFDEGFRLLVHRLFRSPHFLYLIELGAPGDALGKTRRLTDHEIAARLSFSLCETGPDPALWADAKAGALVNGQDKVLGHARRLLASECGRATVRRFFSQWLRLDEVPQIKGDKTVLSTFDAAMAKAMQLETERFVDHLVHGSPGTVANLFDSTFSIVDDKTASLYNLGKVGAQPVRKELPPERRGLLTQPSLLTVTSDEKATSPVLRGMFVLDRLLCGEMPLPPADLEIVAPDLDSTKTTRERWERHSSDPKCSGCHRFIDPVGFALEGFDMVGRHRLTENGKPIDVSGGIPMFGVPAGSIKGAAELSTTIAASPQMLLCFARRWTRFALGRLEGAPDAASLTALAGVAERGGSIRDVLATLAATQSFRQRDPLGSR